MASAGGGRTQEPRERRARGADPPRHRGQGRPARGSCRRTSRPLERARVEGSGRRPAGLAYVLGLKRGGRQPPATRAGEPLRPMTVPNLVGYARIGLVAAFVSLALPSDDGRVTLATVCFAVGAAADYLDGLLARVTGQYSRLGTLMDPFIDRILIVSGAAVDWKFELLPRWALGLLAARELAMVVLVAIGLRRGLDIEINW